MQDDLLMQLASASSEEEKACLLAMTLIETQPSDIREAIVAAAVPHWFDAEILAELLSPAPTNADRAKFSDIYCAIRNLNLPFIQPFGENSLTLHNLTRSGIREHLFKNEKECFKEYSCRIATYFLNVSFHDDDRDEAIKKEAQYRVESIYHQLVHNDWKSRDAFWEQMEVFCKKQRDLSAVNMLIANLLELMTAGIIGGNEIERAPSIGYNMLSALQRNRGNILAAEESYQKVEFYQQQLALQEAKYEAILQSKDEQIAMYKEWLEDKRQSDVRMNTFIKYITTQSQQKHHTSIEHVHGDVIQGSKDFKTKTS